MAHLYFVDPYQRLIAGGQVGLSGQEAHHAARAARLRVGEQVMLGDGRGVLATAEATAVSVEAVTLVVLNVAHTDAWKPQLWLAQSLAKSSRDEHAIEQATEVGVDRIVPVHADRSVVRWDADKAVRGVERWQKIVVEASKQALQPRVASVEPLHTVAALSERAGDFQMIALDHRAEATVLDVPVDGRADALPVVVLVGPEGGWSDSERVELATAGVAVAKLGPGVLRTSSAGPIALALFHARLRHW
ncbi:MAG: RsmE family RNA methyltransferase [Pontimonas sp.]